MSLGEHPLPFFAADGATVLHDEAYRDHVLAHILGARQSLLITQFIVSAEPDRDPGGAVRQLLTALAEAAWRGVDVRLLLSRFAVGHEGMEVNRVAGRFLVARGVPVRLWEPHPDATSRTETHSKIVLVDERVAIVGSHNWSSGALGANRETSLAVTSVDLCRRLRMTFEAQWARSRDVAPAP